MNTKEIPRDDYVQPPTYNDTVILNKTLLSKIETHINNDLTQINSVYDERIKESEKYMKKSIHEIERDFALLKSDINKERDTEIEKYNTEAEKRISELITNLNNGDQTQIRADSFWDWIWKILN